MTSAEHLLPQMLSIAAHAKTYQVSDGELEVAAEMSARGIWHINYRGKDSLYPRLLGTTDTRQQAVNVCVKAKHEMKGSLASDYYICLLLHNLVLSAQPLDDLVPYLCYPLDPTYREQNARDAALFAQVEQDKGKRKLPESIPEARDIEGLLAKIPPGPLREVMAEVSEKLLRHAQPPEGR